jgi:glucose-fructose oxidoreductase
MVGWGSCAESTLPTFRHTRETSELVALVCDDPTTAAEAAKRNKVSRVYSFEQYDDCLRSGSIDAVYLTLPVAMHCAHAVRAAEAGMHVLCNKPMATSEAECRTMIDACQRNHVKLMIAYRMHFEEANLAAIHLAKTGELGDLRFFDSSFSLPTPDENLPGSAARPGSGALLEVGVDCLNAVRHIFRDEPTEVTAFASRTEQWRGGETTCCLLRFPGDRMASLTCNIGASLVAAYRVVGTRGDLRVEPASPHAKRLEHYLTIDGKTNKRLFPRRERIAPELLRFSECILQNRPPEPSGWDGLADVRLVEALHRSAAIGQPVRLAPLVRQNSTSSVDRTQGETSTAEPTAETSLGMDEAVAPAAIS